MADLELELGMEELGEGLGEEVSELDTPAEEEAAFASDDTEGFAKGFPEWDLLPPKK